MLPMFWIFQAYKRKTEAAKKEYLKALAAYRASLVSKVTPWPAGPALIKGGAPRPLGRVNAVVPGKDREARWGHFSLHLPCTTLVPGALCACRFIEFFQKEPSIQWV